MIRFLIWVATLTFLDLGIFGDINVFSVCLKSGFFTTCFQQSANGKMTALTVRSYHAFVKIMLL